jgi:hypothetical protein
VSDEEKFPLRQLVSDPTERFQLPFAEQGALLLQGFSGVATQRTARGLVLMAVADRISRGEGGRGGGRVAGRWRGCPG